MWKHSLPDARFIMRCRLIRGDGCRRVSNVAGSLTQRGKFGWRKH